MSQVRSAYNLQPNECYVTPKWVYDAIYIAEGFTSPWDCCPVNPTFDFLTFKETMGRDIVTNPPFSRATQFIRHALAITQGHKQKVAFLLPHGFDTARLRNDLFTSLPFKAKYTLLRRIRWENLEQKSNGPSQNHAWFVWDWCYSGEPVLRYL